MMHDSQFLHEDVEFNLNYVNKILRIISNEHM